MLAAFLFEWIKHENDENENDWRVSTKRLVSQKYVDYAARKNLVKRCWIYRTQKHCRINASWTYPRLYTRATMVVKSFDA